MNNKATAAAGRVAAALGVIKWVVIGLVALAGLLWVIALSQGSEKYNAETGLFEQTSGASGGLIAAVVFAVLVGILQTWVVFGWLQNTLRMLVRIAVNSDEMVNARAQVPYDRNLTLDANDGGTNQPKPLQ